MSYKDKVSVIGAGCTNFGENFELSYQDLIYQSASEACDEAGIEFKDIDAAWLGTAFPDAGVYKGRSGMDLAEALGLFDIPVTRVSNYCATGGDAFRNACNSLLAGQHDVVLALGVEKLRDRTPTESIVKMMVDAGHPIYQKGFTAAGTFAVFATRHFKEFGTTREDLSQISVKNHRHALHNPKAHIRKELSLEDVMRSPMVAYPITLMESCPTTDGGAAVILTRAEDANKYNPDGKVMVKGHGFSVSTGWDLPFYDPHFDFTGFRATEIASQTAYKQAGVKDPFKEIDFAEVHDCFSIVELLTYEDLGFCEKGKGKDFIQQGTSELGSDLPVNVSGGLLSCGHPVGATGVRMLYELVRQLQGEAGGRQVVDAKLGLAHNIGGPGAVASVTLLGI
jgi:acetyl-CoA C-acetyltransferase